MPHTREAPRQMGVEEELLLLDTQTAMPTAVVEPVLHAARFIDAEHAHLEREVLQEQIEYVSPPTRFLQRISEQLRSGRSLVDAAAIQYGARAVAVGTSLTMGDVHLTEGARYRLLEDHLRLTAQRSLTCGLHVHVEVADDHEGVAVIDRIRTWLPVILALSANSPLWGGSDSGFASYRYQVCGRLPGHGATMVFGSANAYHEQVAQLLHTGVLFDRAMVYFDARLSATHPTVEIRVADTCTEAESAVAIAGIIRALVETASRAWQNGEAPVARSVELHRIAMWQASRSGMNDHLLHPRTSQPVAAAEAASVLLEHIAPALEDASDLAYCTEVVESLCKTGTGAEHQRRLYSTRADPLGMMNDLLERTYGTAPSLVP